MVVEKQVTVMKNKWRKAQKLIQYPLIQAPNYIEWVVSKASCRAPICHQTHLGEIFVVSFSTGQQFPCKLFYTKPKIPKSRELIFSKFSIVCASHPKRHSQAFSHVSHRMSPGNQPHKLPKTKKHRPLQTYLKQIKYKIIPYLQLDEKLKRPLKQLY